MKKLFSALVMGLAIVFMALLTAHAKDELNKTTWKVYEVGALTASDTLTFENGKVYSAALLKQGYVIKQFKTYQLGYKVSWRADLAKSPNDRLRLSGNVEHEAMTGKSVHIDAQGHSTEKYWKAVNTSN